MAIDVVPLTGAELAQIEATAYSVAQVMPRIGALFLVLPFFSGQMLGGVVRSGIVLMLAIYVAPAAGPLPAPGLANWIFVVAKEGLIGLLLGLGFGVLVWAVQSMGDLIDVQTGSSNADFFDPIGGHAGGRTGEFLGWLAITLFVSSGGLLAIVGALVESFQVWPVATFIPRLDDVLLLFAVREGNLLFSWIIKLAGPVLLVLALAEIGIGLVGRVAPQLNVFVFAQPVKSLLATLMLVLTLFYLYESLQDFLRPDNGVLQFLRGAL